MVEIVYDTLPVVDADPTYRYRSRITWIQSPH